MGAQTRIYLPRDLDPIDLTKAAGILAGLPRRIARPAAGSGGVAEIYVEGAEMAASGGVGIAVLSLRGTTAAGPLEAAQVQFYNAELPEYLLLAPRSTPLWIALGSRLVEEFGGKMRRNDALLGTGYDAERAPAEDNRAEIPGAGPARNRAAAERMAERLAALRPVTPDDVADARRYAYYGGL